MIRWLMVCSVGLVGLAGHGQLNAQGANTGIAVCEPYWDGYVVEADPPPYNPTTWCSTSCQASSCCGLSGHVEFLWWTASQTGLSYAAVSTTPEPQPIMGSVDYLGYNWDPGVRVGAAYTLPWNWWVAEAEFTYIEFFANGPVASAPTGGALYSVLAYPTTDSSQDARASYRIDYYVLDLLAKRSLCCCNTLLSPFIGVRLAQIDQTLRYTYSGDPDPNNNNEGRANLEFLGIGLVGGLSGEARVCGGFSLFGKSSFAFLTGRDRNKQRQNSLDPNAGLNAADVTIRFDGSKAVGDIAAGLQWSCGCFTLRAGYEFHHWFNFSQYARFLDAGNQQSFRPADMGHLSVHGLVLTAAYRL